MAMKNCGYTVLQYGIADIPQGHYYLRVLILADLCVWQVLYFSGIVEFIVVV